MLGLVVATVSITTLYLTVRLHSLSLSLRRIPTNLCVACACPSTQSGSLNEVSCRRSGTANSPAFASIRIATCDDSRLISKALRYSSAELRQYQRNG